MLLKKVVSAAVPAMIAVAAFFQAHAVGSLVDASMSGATTPAAIAPFAEAHAAQTPPAVAKERTTSGEVILARNVFDSTARPAPPPVSDIAVGDPTRVPLCDGVRAVITVRADEPDSSFAALDVGGRRHLRKRGGSVDDMRLVYVGDDRVWLQRGDTVCQAPLFAQRPPEPKPPTKPAAAVTASSDWKIEKTGATSFNVDRGTVSRLLEAQTELMKTPLVVEKEGYRLKSVKPGSALASLGLEAGDRLESIDGMSVMNPEGLMQAYARLSTGTLSHLVIHITRGGRPLDLDYNIK